MSDAIVWRRCGTFTKTGDISDSITVTGATYTCTDCFRASTPGMSGDSGAPYGDGRKFMGVHRGEDFFGSGSSVSKASNVFAATGYTLRYS